MWMLHPCLAEYTMTAWKVVVCFRLPWAPVQPRFLDTCILGASKSCPSLFHKWITATKAKENMTQDLVTCLFLCILLCCVWSGWAGLWVCTHTTIWAKTREQISGSLVLLFGWKLASSLDSNLQCLTEQKWRGAGCWLFTFERSCT
jgi:hypothetical protein